MCTVPVSWWSAKYLCRIINDFIQLLTSYHPQELALIGLNNGWSKWPVAVDHRKTKENFLSGLIKGIYFLSDLIVLARVSINGRY